MDYYTFVKGVWNPKTNKYDWIFKDIPANKTSYYIKRGWGPYKTCGYYGDSE